MEGQPSRLGYPYQEGWISPRVYMGKSSPPTQANYIYFPSKPDICEQLVKANKGLLLNKRSEIVSKCRHKNKFHTNNISRRRKTMDT